MFYKTDCGNVCRCAYRSGVSSRPPRMKVEEGMFATEEENDAYARGDAELNVNGPADELNEQL